MMPAQRPSGRKIFLRRTAEFSRAFNQLARVKTLREKYFTSYFQKSMVAYCIPPQAEGVRAIVTIREAGSGGRVRSQPSL
jgi:hypothetical protein